MKDHLHMGWNVNILELQGWAPAPRDPEMD